MFPSGTRGDRFAGRAFTRAQQPPRHAIFHKGRELYASSSKAGYQTQGRACVMEGTWTQQHASTRDRLRGGRHGHGFSVEQARTLLLCACGAGNDQDEAGKKAVRRCIDVFREAGGRSRVVTFAGAKDPDEYVRKYGGDKFEDLIENAPADIRFIYEEAAKSADISSVEGKLRVKDIMVPVLASLDSEFEISVYTSELSRQLDVRKESLERDVELYRRRRGGARRDGV